MQGLPGLAAWSQAIIANIGSKMSGSWLACTGRNPFRNCLRPRVRRLLLLLFLGLTFSPASALAWKPTTHAFLAKLALDDALDDGRVVIPLVDYSNGRILGVVGSYAVDPAVLAALRSNPSQYRAGVLGPDAYPDILTGQQVIHPAESETKVVGGPGAWLSHVWARANGANTPAIRAFALGYLTHAGGDMFGHTFVNNFTGAPFVITPPAGPANAIKHIVVEGYVDKRLSGNAMSGDPSFFDVSIDGVQPFIYQTLIDARPGTVLDASLLKARAPGTDYSIPRIFSTMRASLGRDINQYYAKKKEYDDRAAACKTWDPRCSRVAITAAKVAYMAKNAAQITYKEAWRDDIDSGLRAWPAVSHEVAKALFFNPGRSADIQRAENVMQKYATDHLLSMAGAPDFVGLSASTIASLIEAITPDFLLQPIRQLKQDLLNTMLKSAIGMDKNELKAYLSSPEKYFDQVMGSGTGEITSLRAFNANYIKISDPGFANPAEYFNPESVPAAYNTIVISKLIMLGQGEVNRLLGDLQSSARLQQSNVMLGFINTLDGDNQWVAPPDRMVFARDCSAYRKIFMKQPGERGGCAVSAP